MFDGSEEVPKAEPDAKGDEHLAQAQAVSAPILFYELLVLHAEPSTRSNAATVTKQPKIKRADLEIVP